MPELARFFGIVVSVFYGDHNPPHIHVSHGDRRRTEWAAQVTLDGRVLEGYVPPRELKLVRKWLRLRRDELRKACDLARQDVEPGKISPLKVR